MSEPEEPRRGSIAPGAEDAGAALLGPGPEMAPVAASLRLTGLAGTPVLRGWLQLVGFLAAIPAGVALVERSQGQWPMVLYAAVLVALYGVGSAYHLLPMGRPARRLMRRVDHAMIFVFMGAAYSPLSYYVLSGTESHVILGLEWVGAAAGVVITTASFERTRVLSGALYLLLGWLAVLTLPAVFERLGAGQITLLFVMGACYTGGAAVLARRRPDPRPEVFGYHEVWHLAVLIGSLCYYLVLWSLAGPLGR